MKIHLNWLKHLTYFFKEKIEKHVTGIKKGQNSDPFSLLKDKLHGSKLRFNLRTVNEREVLKLLKSLKSKKAMDVMALAQKF